MCQPKAQAAGRLPSAPPPQGSRDAQPHLSKSCTALGQPAKEFPIIWDGYGHKPLGNSALTPGCPAAEDGLCLPPLPTREGSHLA